MTRLFLTAVLAVAMFACGENKPAETTNVDSAATTTTTPEVTAPDTASATVDTAKVDTTAKK